jgi:hypothetical protein
MAKLTNRSRVLVVTGLIILWVGPTLPDLRRVFGFPFGDYGFSSVDSLVTRVDHEGVAAHAGIRVGDHITFGDASPISRWAVARGLALHPGDALSGSVKDDRHARDVTLVAVPESRQDLAFVALRFALAFLTIGIAAALLLSRPEIATWGFFLYCLTVITLPGAVFSFAIPESVKYATNPIFVALYNASAFGGALFALAFAGQPWSNWRRFVLAFAITAAVVTTVADASSPFIFRSNVVERVDDIYAALMLLTMLVGLVDSYRHDVGASRQRLQWMIAALLITVPAHYIAGWYFPGPLTYGEYASLIAVQALLPLVAGYAMFRRRVVDVKFVASRTLVYGAMTALLVAIFSFLDAVLSRSFAESRVSLSIDVIVALLLGFSLNSAHRRVDAVIDRVVFRDRHRAELQLERSAAGLVHATDETVIADTLVRLPAGVLGLTGAALYRVNGTLFARSVASAEFSSLPQTVDRNDALPLYLRSEPQPVRLESLPLSKFFDAHNSAAPVLAMPITMRGELDGFVVYGAHQNGADIDPDEQRALAPLVRNAAIAFDHLETVALRARVADLEAKLLQLTQPM